MTYSEQLKHPKWQRKRLEIFERDNYTCLLCKSNENQLSVHHGFYMNTFKLWDYPNESLFTLCIECHNHVTQQSNVIKRELGFLPTELFLEFSEILKLLSSKKDKKRELSHILSFLNFDYD